MGREAQEGGGVYILTDSQCLTAAASNYLPIKNEKKKQMEIRRPLFPSVKVAVRPVLDLVLALSAPGCVEGGGSDEG